ncbi:hypothetical protein SAMN04488244_1341 [Vibrio hangzhouensis]|uniref:Uncharacterized protein n=1 Tax=Vibrio hangzhouensis TaxID=462991 RepID=A0A1H6C9Q7_9VIBR|nr:hypothetical protein SAMN04488244_1341 [Vibrio hangzhouensis]
MVLWFYGSMVLWFYGSMVLWFYGSVVLWFTETNKALLINNLMQSIIHQTP